MDLSRAFSSARPWMARTPVSPSWAETSFSQSTRLFRLSSNVTSNWGSRIFRGRPGKPAPVPTSSRVRA